MKNKYEIKLCNFKMKVTLLKGRLNIYTFFALLRGVCEGGGECIFTLAHPPNYLWIESKIQSLDGRVSGKQRNMHVKLGIGGDDDDDDDDDVLDLGMFVCR